MKRTRIILAFLLVLLTVSCVGAPAKTSAPPAGESVVITVLHFNDWHGSIEADKDGQGGLAAFATVVKALQGAYKDSLLLSAGDFNTGQMVADKNSGFLDIDAFNMLGLTATAVGNHEFDKKLGVLEAQIKRAKFPFLAANIVREDGTPFVKPYMIKEIGGLKVGIFGLTTSDTVVKAHPFNVKGLKFTDEIEAARSTVAILRGKEKVDIVIALVHLGMGASGDRGKIPSEKIAESVPGIDLIIDGHSHSDLDAPVLINGIPILQAADSSRILGKAMLLYDKGTVKLLAWNEIPINLIDKDKKLIGGRVEPDPEFAAFVKKYIDEINVAYGAKIGETRAVFDLGDRLTRKQETALGDLVCDALVAKAKKMGIKADFSLFNGGGIRKSLPAGIVSRKNAYEVLPFGNTIVTYSLSGTQVLELFAGNAKIALGNGGFANCSAEARYTINYNTGMAENLTIGGKAVDPTATYIVVTNDFIAAGGDGVFPVFVGKPYTDTGIDALEALVEYFQDQKAPFEPKTDGRLIIIPKS